MTPPEGAAVGGAGGGAPGSGGGGGPSELLVDAGTGDGVALAGSTCGRCGLVAFPAERFGCERCGAPPAEIDPTPLAPTGTVRSAVTVHRPAPDLPAPFVVVDVVLDAGPTVTAVALVAMGDDGDHGHALATGDRVEGVVYEGRFRFAPT